MVEEEVVDESWDVSEDKDLTRVFIRCLCLTVGAEVIPSRDSMSEERDFTKLKKGFSLEGKLNDLVGWELEVEPFCSAKRDDGLCVGELLA